MTSPHLLDDLRRDEGCRLKAYPDPLSGGEPWTIGYGCTGPDIDPHTTWTQQEADDRLLHDVARTTSDLLSAIPWITLLEAERSSVLIQMAYNMGVAGLLGFKNTLGLIKAGHYDTAAVAMLQSKWATQLPTRAKRLAAQMRTGVHQP